MRHVYVNMLGHAVKVFLTLGSRKIPEILWIRTTGIRLRAWGSDL